MIRRRAGRPRGSGDGVGGTIAWSGAYRVVTQGSALVAVPILLHALGTDVYAVWVLASTLVFAQGLIDLGFAAVLIRFVAIGTAEGSVEYVRSVLLRVSAMYAGLSLLGVALWFAAEPIARRLPYIDGAELDEAVALLRYMAVAFALTNATMVVQAALQGLHRVAAAFRAQTIGALAFLPALIAGMLVLPDVDAVDAAALLSYGLPLVVLVPALWREMRRLPRCPVEPPTMRAMLTVGLKWQVSNWADYATYQLPRLVSGVFLSSLAVVVIDLALRLGQALATPLFAMYPLVLPRASAAWVQRGREGLRGLLRPLLQIGTPLFVVFAAVAVPTAGPVIAIWSGQDLSWADSVAASCVVAGVLAHASTGLLSSVLLATSELQSIVRYKSFQLAIAVPLVVAGALVSGPALGLGLAVTLALPAAWFNRRALLVMQLSGGFSPRLWLGAAGALLASAAVVICAVAVSLPLAALLAAGATAVGAPLVWPLARTALASLRGRERAPPSADGARLEEQLHREEVGPMPQTAQLATPQWEEWRRAD